MKTYLITGATGQQGRAVINHLLASPDGRAGRLRIHATVRDVSSPAAAALDALPHVAVFPFRDYFDFDAFRAAAADPTAVEGGGGGGGGIAGLFLNLVEHPEADAQARGILEAVRPGGVVYASSYSCGDRGAWDDGDPMVVAFFEGHWKAENVIREASKSANRPYTILRPFWIMSNYLLPAAGWAYPGLSSSNPASLSPSSAGVQGRHLVTSLDPGVRMSHVSEDDIGKFGAAALLDIAAGSGGKFDGAEFNLGRDNLTAEEIARTLAEVSGVEVGVMRRKRIVSGREGEEEAEPAPERAMIQSFERWTNRNGGDVDGDALEAKFGIRLATFREYLQDRKGEVIRTLTAELDG